MFLLYSPLISSCDDTTPLKTTPLQCRHMHQKTRIIVVHKSHHCAGEKCEMSTTQSGMCPLRATNLVCPHCCRAHARPIEQPHNKEQVFERLWIMVAKGQAIGWSSPCSWSLPAVQHMFFDTFQAKNLHLYGAYNAKSAHLPKLSSS
jgi:hypothetical protein